MHDEIAPQSVKDRIIFAAIECIEKDGIQAVTTRKIASEADVNVAAINYYFGSKDKLLDEVFHARISHVFEEHIEEFKKNKQGITIASYKELIYDMLEGMMNYPNFTRALLHEPLFNNKYDDFTVTTFNNFLREIEGISKKFIPQKKILDIKMLIIQFMSCILMLGIMPELFNDYLGDSFKNPENKKKFLDQLFANFIHNDPGILK